MLCLYFLCYLCFFLLLGDVVPAGSILGWNEGYGGKRWVWEYWGHWYMGVVGEYEGIGVMVCKGVIGGNGSSGY